MLLDDPQNVLILKHLFSSALSNEEFIGNKYNWALFRAFTNHKDKIEIDFFHLSKHYDNKNLLGLILTDLSEIGDDEKYSEENYKNKNILKPEILSTFRKVTNLEIFCNEHPLSFESLLLLIRGKEIAYVKIYDVFNTWISEAPYLTNE